MCLQSVPQFSAFSRQGARLKGIPPKFHSMCSHINSVQAGNKCTLVHLFLTRIIRQTLTEFSPRVTLLSNTS